MPFKRSTKGMVLGPEPVRIERSRIQFFAETLGESDPIHFSVEAAQEAGYPDLVAPPSFLIVVEAAANDARRRRGDPGLPDVLGFDFRYLLHGHEAFAYDELMFAGDEVAFSTHIVDFYDRHGGRLEFATVHTAAHHATRGCLVRAERTLIHKLPEPAA